MSDSRETRTEITALRDQVRAANRKLQRLSSKAHSFGALDRDGIRELKITLKSLGRRMRGAETAAALRELLADYEKATSSMRARLADVEPDATGDAEGVSGAETSSVGSTPVVVLDSGPGAAAGVGSGQETTVGGFTKEQQDWIDAQYKLVNLITLRGVSPSRALARLGIDRSVRWARSLLKRYREEGFEAFVDKRWKRSFESPARPVKLEKLVKVTIHDLPAAGPKALWEEVCRRCRERDWTEPSCSTVKRIVYDIPPIEMAHLKEDTEKLDKCLKPVHRVELAKFANDRFQIDHSMLDLWMRILIGATWVAVRPWITAIIDVYSRSVAGYFLSGGHPDAMSIGLAVQHAIRPKDTPGWYNKGLPGVIQHDHGADFMSNAVTTWFARAGIAWDPIPPHYPNANGKIERFFQTLDTSLMRRLPGHTRAIGVTEEAAAKRVTEFLTRDQLEAEIDAWIVSVYHQTVHSTTREKPADRWERNVRLRMPEDDAIYRDMMLKVDQTRTVHNDGLRFTVDGKGGRYWSPELAHHAGEEVVIEYHPELLESILVKDPATNEILAEAWCMDVDDPKYTIADVQRCSREIVKGLEERLEDHREAVAIDDREKARERHEQALQRELKNEDEEDPAEESDEDAALEDLINQLREGDRA